MQADISDCTAAMVHPNPEDRCNEQGVTDEPPLHDHTPQGPPDGRLVEEKAEDASGSGMYPVPGRKLRMDFCPADMLLLQSNALPLNLITLISDKFCRANDKTNVAVADNHESQPLPDRIQT